MMFKKLILLCLILLLGVYYCLLYAQDNLFASYTTTPGREKLYHNLLNQSINKNLALSISDTTLEKWQEAFWALELLQYKNAWVNTRIQNAFDSIDYCSDDFKRALLELAYTNYPSVFINNVNTILHKTDDPKIFVMCAEYLLQHDANSKTFRIIEDQIKNKISVFPPDNPLIKMVEQRMQELKHPLLPLKTNKFFADLLDKNFLPGETILYSFQRKNRDFAGVAIVRNMEGKFIRDSAGKIFNVSQLARSLSNLPEYITNGNTPQGIFRMKGFDVSLNRFIGPTPNIQLSMPVEATLQHFLKDSCITDTIWNIDHYTGILPNNLKNYLPLYNTYYAGLAGRNEIIAHGTTIDPEYYLGKNYYPHTPSLGCLCTKEIWDGKRVESNQQKLVFALLQAGGADGYCVVIEIDDKQQPVTIEEILPQLLKAESIK